MGGVSEGEVQDRVSVMRISYDIAMIGLKCCLRAAGDVDFRQLEAEFYRVFALARKYLEPNPRGMTAKVQRIIFGLDKETSNGKGSRNSGLSVHLAIIAPLIFVLKKCPSAKLSDEAMSLLTVRPWREGPWESIAMAGMAREKRDEENLTRSGNRTIRRSDNN